MTTGRLGSFIITLVFVTFAGEIKSQKNSDSSSTDQFVGVWQGTSICQIKSSPCHDEKVVYHISKAKEPNTIDILMNKIVDGSEEEMGTITFKYSSATKELISASRPDDTWKYKLNKTVLEGTLYYQGKLYRIIKVAKK